MKEYDILFSFDSIDTKKTYVGCTDHIFSSNGRKKIYIVAYNPMNLGMELENIVNEKESNMIKKVLYEIDETSRNKEEKENE